MNILDIQDTPSLEELGQTCRLKAIFEAQRKLMHKYHQIEKDNGLLQTEKVPVNLDDKYGQARLKDFAWRFTEEMGEAWEAWQQGDIQHYHEELSDAMHFLVELCILAGLEPEEAIGLQDGPCRLTTMMEAIKDASKISPTPPDRKTEFEAYIWGNAVAAMGITMNNLKQKPWKQTHQATDRKKFYGCLQDALVAFFMIFEELGFTAEGVMKIYFLKNQVNQFRQRSSY